MDIEQLALLVKKYIEVSKKTELKPGISYILERSLKIDALRTLIQKELKGTNDYLRLFYMVFFLFEGDSMEVAKYKAFNELYYLILQEVGDIEYIEMDCDYCGGTGRIECDECDSYGFADCSGCDGAGGFTNYADGYEECEECEGQGEKVCEYCDGQNEVECSECEGSGVIESEDEYVFLNNEYWVFYGDEISDELSNATNKSNNELIDAYDILDKIRGSVYLLKTESESVKLTLYDFEAEFGDYYDAQGKYSVNSVYNLNDFDLSKSFNISKFSNSYVIR